MPGLAPLLDRQRTQLMLGEHAGLATVAQAEKFLASVAIALRYGASDALPLASMYQAVFAARSKLASMFKHCVSRAELDAAIDALAADGRVEVDGKTVVARPGRRSPAS